MKREAEGVAAGGPDSTRRRVSRGPHDQAAPAGGPAAPGTLDPPAALPQRLSGTSSSSGLTLNLPRDKAAQDSQKPPKGGQQQPLLVPEAGSQPGVARLHSALPQGSTLILVMPVRNVPDVMGAVFSTQQGGVSAGLYANQQLCGVCRFMLLDAALQHCTALMEVARALAPAPPYKQQQLDKEVQAAAEQDAGLEDEQSARWANLLRAASEASHQADPATVPAQAEDKRSVPVPPATVLPLPATSMPVPPVAVPNSKLTVAVPPVELHAISTRPRATRSVPVPSPTNTPLQLLDELQVPPPLDFAAGTRNLCSNVLGAHEMVMSATKMLSYAQPTHMHVQLPLVQGGVLLQPTPQYVFMYRP